MIVIDTNVVSELMRSTPAPQVMDWWNQQRIAELFLTALTEAEILFGLETLPRGRRRTALAAAAKETFDQDFDGRILPFDREAAREFALIAAARRGRGLPISQVDAQIAAIARSRGAAVATRNTKDFDHCGVTVIDPWSA